jgi:hypothetical protein
MKHLRGILFLGLCLAVPQALLAREDPDWLACDFVPDPQAGSGAQMRWEDDGREAGVASGLYTPSGRAHFDIDGLAACNKVLASPEATQLPPLRRFSLLAARAVHQMAAGDADPALASLDEAAAALPAGLDPLKRARTIDVMLDVLRGVALVTKGDAPAGQALLLKAGTQVRWNSELLGLISTTLDQMPGGRAVSLPLAEQRLLLDAGARADRARSRQAGGDFAGALADWKQIDPPVTAAITDVVPMAGFMSNGRPGFPVQTLDMPRLNAAVLAAAMAGEAETARTWIAEARATASNLKDIVLPPMLQGRNLPNVDRAALADDIANTAALAEAALLFKAGKSDEARAAVLTIGSVRSRPETLQLITRILDQPAPATAWRMQAVRLLFAMLPRYEDRGANALPRGAPSAGLLGGLVGIKLPVADRYGKGSKFWGTAGFRDRAMAEGPNKRPGARTVVFSGTVSPTMVTSEMALLRAAELAVAAGQRYLVILGSRQYQKQQQAYYGGSPIGSPSAAGFQSELDVVFTNAAEARAIEAATVFEALAPVYRPAG